MSFIFNNQRKSKNNNNQTPKYFLSSNKKSSTINKSQKRSISQKKQFIPSDIITQIPASNLYLNNFNSSNNLNFNNLHQQAFTPINRRKKLYEDEFFIPEKSSKFKGKKTLVLDLDETLVHSSFIPFEKNDLILNVNFDGVFYNIYVLVRPGAEQFIKEMGKYFEIVTFTASIESYASPLLDLLDKENHVQYRLYRDHCNFVNGVFIKDLKRLNRSLKDIIILDNSPMAYAFDVDNGLPILSWFDNRDDKELIRVQQILKFLSYVDDVRKYIKIFLKNNCIDYQIAKAIIKQYKENKKNKKELTNNDIKIDKSGFEEEKGESNKNQSFGLDKRKNKNNKIKNLKGINNNINLFNNFIIKNEINNIPNIINNEININNLKNFDNKINNLKSEKKLLKLKLQNNNNNHNNNSLVKSLEIDKKNNTQLNKNNIKNKKQEKKNLFRLGLMKENSNNISPINNIFNSQSKLHSIDISNLENDIKLNDNIIMPKILAQNVKTSKSSTFQLNQNNKKNNNDKNKLIKKNNYFLNSNHKSIEPISLKKNLNYEINESSRIKFFNLMEKFQDSTSKSSSLNVINNMKTNIKINKGLKSAKFKINNSSTNKKNKNSLKSRLKLSSKPINNLNNNNIDLNLYVDKKKLTDISSHVLRSKSTGNFVKLQTVHPKTPKTINNLINSNLINSEDNKINIFN